jgi:hypothetical protein
MPRQPVGQENVKIIFSRVGISSGNQGYRANAFEKKKHHTFQQYDSYTNLHSFVNPVDNYCIIQIKYQQIEKHPDDAVYQLDKDEFSIWR